MRRSDERSLWSSLSDAGNLSSRSVSGTKGTVFLDGLARGTSLACPLAELRGRSIIVATQDQLTAALALIELDGIARRLVVFPPDLALEHVPSSVIDAAAIDAVISDREASSPEPRRLERLIGCRPALVPSVLERSPSEKTEWILFTSGTTGVPKMVRHSFASLTGAIETGSSTLGSRAVWSTFYDIRRYGGLQIFLRALLGGGSLVLSSSAEPTADFLVRAGAAGVTHISGTPSHWRRALMSPMARRLAPHYVRLSGEIADQAILDRLRAFYPEAGVAHAFASTEAGVAFDVRDGMAGFPASLIGRLANGVETKIDGGSLRIRSALTATGYLGNPGETLLSADGFVDTGDMVELRDGRYYFVGRRGGIINVGGLKVHPEEVEAVINRHPNVEASMVSARKNPITGAIVVADVVVRAGPEGSDISSAETVKHEILESCRRVLPAHKVPAAIRIVPSLDITASGKMARLNA
jgi:acyl-coenzyme A synthetase/AMP-(fatty) acid ligase